MNVWHLELKDKLCTFVAEDYAIFAMVISETRYHIWEEDNQGNLIYANDFDIDWASTRLQELLCFLK